MAQKSYSEIMGDLRRLKASGASRADGEKYAAANGWSFDELKTSAEQGGTLTNITAPVLQGLTFGYGDEIAAGLGTGFGLLGDYDSALKDQRAVLKRARSENPLGSSLLEFGGSILPSLTSAPLAIGKSVGSTIARGAGLGAVEGAIYGSGSAEEGARAEGAAKGAAFGGLLGGALPAGVELGKAAYRGIRGVTTPSTAASAELRRALSRDQIPADELLQRASDANSVAPGTATLADVGGENVRGLVERVAQTPGAGRNKIIPFLEKRQVEQIDRIAGNLKGLIGTSGSAREAIAASQIAAKRDAMPFKARAMEVDITGDANLQGFIADMIQRPAGEKALRKAREIAGNKGIEIPDRGPFDMQAADLLFRGLNDVIGDNTRVSMLGREELTAVGQSVMSLKQQFRDILDPVNPDYAKFRQLWSGEAAFQRAAERGRKSFMRMDSDELTDYLGSISSSEASAFKAGAVSALSAAMGRNTAKLPDLTKSMRSPEMRKKIAALMDSPELQQKWSQALDFEQGVSDLTRQATGNSATPRRLAEQEDRASADLIADIAADSLMGTSFGQTLLKTIGRAPRAVNDTLRAMTDDALAEALMNPDALSQAANLQDLTRTPLGYKGTPNRLAPSVTPGLAGLLAGGTENDPGFPYP